ncbi:MAG: TIGR01459 family HAD-type hydrolase [Pseudomonadota bacterium]
MTRDITGLAEIRTEFDAVLIDQFGVLHDGQTQFPGTRECLEALAAEGVPVAALSNSGKRSSLNIARLERLGFSAALFRNVITSGELGHDRIARLLAGGELARDTPVAVISRDGDTSMIDGLSVRHVGLREGPRLLILAAAEPETRTLESYLDELEPLAKAGVPALCINPDRHIYANGVAAFGPGMLAEHYQALGGTVEMLGKPGIEMFRAGCATLGDGPADRVLMIGDSHAHDIAGAAAAGCRTLLISSGVQAGTDHGVAEADFQMDRLRW